MLHTLSSPQTAAEPEVGVLCIAAEATDQVYETVVKITDAQLQALNISRSDVLPQWNYTLRPNVLLVRSRVPWKPVPDA